MAGITATYISPSGFTVETDRTIEFIAGRRVKANCNVDGFKIGTITSSALSAGNTTVNLTAGSDDLTTNLTEIYYGISEGTSGSIPIHNHSGDEGSGGVITELSKEITFLSKAGYNSQFVIIDNILYSASGSSAGHTNYTTGRGSDNQNPYYGLYNFKRVPLPSSSPIVEVGGGYANFAYALLENGDLYTWGLNGQGQCGLGNTTNTPIPTSAAAHVTNVYSHPTNGGYANSGNRLYIKKTDGYIYGTGDNASGALGQDDVTDRDEFTQITDLGTTVESFWNMGSTYGCAVAQKADKSIWVCGNNSDGQLGLGNTTSPIDEFADVTSAWNASASTLINVIGAFGYYTSGLVVICVLGMFFDDGTNTSLKMCGENTQSELGDTTTTDRTTPITPNVGSGRIAKVTGLSGIMTTHCLKEDGNLYSWGYNGQGLVGDGSTTNENTPTINATDVIDIFCDGASYERYGYYNQMFIKKSDNQLYAVGYNSYAQCGIGNTTTPIQTFTRVLMPYDEEVIEIGNFVTTGSGNIIIAQTASNKLYAWGYNVQNGISASATVNCYAPTQVRLP